MKVEILGNAGGACKNFYTSCALLDDRLALDAGTGLHTLSADKMLAIKDIVITHIHMDHITMLCFLTDYHAINGSTITVHCLPETEANLRQFLFNNVLWPAMQDIYVKKNKPVLAFKTLTPYKKVNINGTRLTPLPVSHGIPTLGYCLHGDKENFIFCFDMLDAPDEFWRYLKRLKNFRRMTIELSFPDEMEALARASYHLTPKLLQDLMKKIPPQVALFYNHNKVQHTATIRRQVRRSPLSARVEPLRRGSIFQI